MAKHFRMNAGQVRIRIGRLTTWLGLCFLLQNTPLALPARGTPSPNWEARIDSLLHTTSVRPFNGKVLIAKGKKILYRSTVGMADFQTKVAFRKHSQFVLGSVSKQFTAVLVLEACDKGLIDLHAPIRKYLPSLPMSWADTVTVHQLLNHTSGYQGKDTTLAFPAGSRFSYSNQAYGLLGEIVSQVQGTTYEVLVANLFQRCGMSHSATPGSAAQNALLSGFSKLPDGKIGQEANTFSGIPLAAGLLISTPKDLLRWNDCLHIQRKLLSSDSYARMIAPTSKRPHPIFGDVDYAYGLQMTHQDGIFEISHGGYAPGFVAVNFYYPVQKISLIVMENLDWKDPAFKESYHFEMEIRRILRQSGMVSNTSP